MSPRNRKSRRKFGEPEPEPETELEFADARLENPQFLKHVTDDNFELTLTENRFPQFTWDWYVASVEDNAHRRQPQHPEHCTGQARNKRRALKYALAALKFMRENP